MTTTIMCIHLPLRPKGIYDHAPSCHLLPTWCFYRQLTVVWLPITTGIHIEQYKIQYDNRGIARTIIVCHYVQQQLQRMTEQYNLVGQIYCTFSMGESLAICNKRPTNFIYFELCISTYNWLYNR